MAALTTPVAPGTPLCASSALRDGESGLRFTVELAGQPVPAFAIRHAGRVHAYLNRCAHQAVELDWQPGQFFDAERRYLVCATHGAMYDPATGSCVSGRCRGRDLQVLAVIEEDGQVRLAQLPPQ